ncbi:MAG: hypothetical protein JO354_07125 [Verrucomicrobia bacterium]|nr:hypothetical protein [Verrucomicrobiota bacterium]
MTPISSAEITSASRGCASSLLKIFPLERYIGNSYVLRLLVLLLVLLLVILLLLVLTRKRPEILQWKYSIA